MGEVWDQLKGTGSDEEDKMKLVNAKRFICALEGIPTNRLLNKVIEFDG